MNTGKLLGAAIGASFVTIAALAACSDPLHAGAEPAPETPVFVTPDASTPDVEQELTYCPAYECPAPYATCADKSGLCTTNTSNDTEHCGSCDVKCPTEVSGLKGFFVCSNSRCEMLCHENSGDCDHIVDNGCEASLDSDPNNCGACGIKCAAGDVCWQGACGCPSGQVVCNGQCVRLSDDAKNCGACGNECETAPSDSISWTCGEGVIPDGAAIACVDSKCQPTCKGDHSDCNSNFCGDGCEVSVTDDSKNCGACGRSCTDDQVCFDSKCLCDPGMARCGFNCVELQNDARNCGACGNICPGLDGPSGAPVCDLGTCSFRCAIGFGNCDGRLENGCEVDTNSDPNHCGSCATQCAPGQPCIGGKCLTQPCDAGVVN